MKLNIICHFFRILLISLFVSIVCDGFVGFEGLSIGLFDELFEKTNGFKEPFEVLEMICINSVGKYSLWYCKWFGSAFCWSS